MMHFVCTLLLMVAGGLRIIVIKEVQNYLFNKNILLFIYKYVACLYCIGTEDGSLTEIDLIINDL